MATIPGVNVTVNDGGLRVQRPVSGPTVLLIGTTTSTDLAINEPYTVVDINLALHAVRSATTGAFGQREESELSLALTETVNAGAQRIEIVKTATADGLNYSGYTTYERYMALSGTYEALKAHPTDIIVPVGVYAEDIIATDFYALSGHFTGVHNTVTDSFARQLAQFCYEQTVNHNTTIGVIAVKPPMLSPLSGSAARSGYTMGTDTGILFGTPSLTLTNNWVNYVTGGYPDRVNSIHLNYMNGSDTTYNTNYLIASAFQARTSAGVGAVDDLGRKVDAGAYINVVAAPLKSTSAVVRKIAIEKSASGSNVTYNTNGAAAYAGLIASLVPHSGTTNKSIPGIVGARKLSLTQVQYLTDFRMVTLLDRPRGFVVVKGVTGAFKVDDYTKSDFTQLTTGRITQSAIDVVRNAADPYIGEAMNPATMNAMREAIETGLRGMKLAGALNRYEFNILASPDQQALGIATVDLTIVPAFELTQVNVSVKLAKS